MVLMAAAADDDHGRGRRHRGGNPASPRSGSPAPAPPAPAPSHSHRRPLHSFCFPTLSWGTHRLLRCSKDPASSPPPPAPDTPSPDKEKARRPTGGSDGGGRGGSPQRPPQWPWNLRTRRSSTAEPRAVGSDDAADAAADRAPARPAETRKRGFSIALSKEEIAEDFMAIRGTRPPRRPKKRPRTDQKPLDLLFPGLCLLEVKPDSYKIDER